MTGSNIAAAINAAHEQVEIAKRQAVKHAIDCGRLLSEAKATVKHGEWDAWVSANCSFSMRTAQLYMKAHRHVGDDDEKAQRVADLSLRDLAAFMARYRSDEIAAQRLADLWDSSDQRARATFALELYAAGEIKESGLQSMLVAAGLTPEKGAENIAKMFSAFVPPAKHAALIDALKKAGYPDFIAAIARAYPPAGESQ